MFSTRSVTSDRRWCSNRMRTRSVLIRFDTTRVFIVWLSILILHRSQVSGITRPPIYQSRTTVIHAKPKWLSYLALVGKKNLIQSWFSYCKYLFQIICDQIKLWIRSIQISLHLYETINPPKLPGSYSKEWLIYWLRGLGIMCIEHHMKKVSNIQTHQAKCINYNDTHSSLISTETPAF